MKKNNKGFTLAELLIVVAIIAVLVAIAIPVFTTQLEKSREATDMANLRSAYASVVMSFLDDGQTASVSVDAVQTQGSWQNSALGTINGFDESGTNTVTVTAKTVGSAYTVSIDSSGVVSVA